MAEGLPAFSPAVPLVPSEPAPRRPRGAVAPLTTTERFRIPGRFGELSASTLTGILWTLERGYLEDWSDLVQYALTTDDELQSLYTTTITRVTQATWKVVPNKWGDETLAELAADFCDEMLGRMSGWRQAQKTLLHALALGFQPMEKEWERDAVARKNLVRRLVFRHGHRFRLDTQYQYRLYDHGDHRCTKHSQYGRVLDPNRWIVHKHQSVAGYPTAAGLMLPGIWRWMFTRWGSKDYVRIVEKHGAPYIYVKVPPDSPQHVRDEAKAFLEDFHSGKASVFEEGSNLVFEAGASISGEPIHEVYLRGARASMAKLWLGASDITDPGANGSNAAVNTRAGVTADPRMVAYGLELGETVSDQLFRQALDLNRHLFGGKLPPVPTYEANTASDEVQVDKQDLAEQSGGSITRGALDERMSTGTPEPTDSEATLNRDADDGAIQLTEDAELDALLAEADTLLGGS